MNLTLTYDPNNSREILALYVVKSVVFVDDARLSFSSFARVVSLDWLLVRVCTSFSVAFSPAFLFSALQIFFTMMSHKLVSDFNSSTVNPSAVAYCSMLLL